VTTRSLKAPDLLLAPRLEPAEVAALLGPAGIKEIARADANLQAVADDPAARQLLAEILEELLSCLARSADPDQALNYFERFTRAAVNKVHLLSYLKESPRTLEILAKTFGGSPYMAEILIRDPLSLYWVTDPLILDHCRRKRDLERELRRALRPLKTEEKRLDFLRAFKRKEMLQIGVRDLLRLASVRETLASLSTLAEVLISAAYWICDSALRDEYEALSRPGARKRFAGFTVLGMGKLGGGELNFSSDVDLIYLYASDEAGDSGISAPEYFRRLAQKITAALSDVTSEGYVYRVDLRLRPEGRMGNIAYSLAGCDRYYRTRGETWERLALLKAWPVAGDRALGRRFLELMRPFIYDQPFDLKALNEVKSMKQRIDQQLSVRQQSRRNVKLGFGGIREIELVVQSLQVFLGREFPRARARNTLRSLRALQEGRLLSREERDTLTEAYLFLRDVENKLQIVNDAQTHSLPTTDEELGACARRLGYPAAEQFLADYRAHTSQVNRIFENVLGLAERFRVKGARHEAIERTTGSTGKT
jgi:glutamate-ammonia-ligase adenylyltransferase